MGVTVADARFMKPLDVELIRRLAGEHDAMLTVEENAIGGFGAHVLHFMVLDGLLDDVSTNMGWARLWMIIRARAGMKYPLIMPAQDTALMEGAGSLTEHGGGEAGPGVGSPRCRSWLRDVLKHEPRLLNGIYPICR